MILPISFGLHVNKIGTKTCQGHFCGEIFVDHSVIYFVLDFVPFLDSILSLIWTFASLTLPSAWSVSLWVSATACEVLGCGCSGICDVPQIQLSLLLP